MAGYHHIVCCLDFSPHADLALAAAADQVRREGARLTLLHVLAPGRPLLPGGDPRQVKRLSAAQIRQRLETALAERYRDALGELPLEVELRRGHPSVEILSYLAESGADLVVLGSEGLSGVGLVLLGSVAERVIRKAPCSCLVVRRPA